MQSPSRAAVPRIAHAEKRESGQRDMTSWSADLRPDDVTLYRELEALAGFINDAKSEIAALRPHEIREKHLPAATDELDAIVSATAEATNTILDAVDAISKIGTALDEEPGQALREYVTAIYQACSFQDITGQRINKVVRTLKQIEIKVDQLLGAFGDDVARRRTATAAAQAVAAAERDKPRQAHLLNGPPPPQEAVTQADIDALFSKP